VVTSNSLNLNWTFRKFQKNSRLLIEGFFVDWIGIEAPNVQNKPIVNQSVTASELKMLHHLKLCYPFVQDFFVDDFKKIPLDRKADDKSWTDFLKGTFTNYLNKHEKDLNKLNLFFPVNESLSIGNHQDASAVIDEPVIQLSDYQISVMMRRIRFFESFFGKSIIVRRIFWHRLNTIIHIILRHEKL
jgi:hypothetical protein